MIPKLVTLPNFVHKVLPAGVYDVTVDEIRIAYSTNPKRSRLFAGLVLGVKALSLAGCKHIYLNGSFVTSKLNPGDYDACWDIAEVKPWLLDPVFQEFDRGRESQKAKYLGEYFPSNMVESLSGKTFLDFFQSIPGSVTRKGILRINLQDDLNLGSTFQ